MTKTLFVAAAAALLSLTAGGCATMTTGTTQAITIDSEPQQADCTLTREGQELGTVKTPSPITIKRHAATVHVTCRKEGYDDGRVVMNSRFESASAGNFVLGGIIGVMVDASSGANSRYDQYVMVRMESLSPADRAAAASRPKIEPQVVLATPAQLSPPAPVRPDAAPSLPPVPAAGFNGEYRGNIDMPGVSNVLPVTLKFVDGRGTASVTRTRCPTAGTVNLVATATGQVVGEADLVTDFSCSIKKAKITGKADAATVSLLFETDQASKQIVFDRR